MTMDLVAAGSIASRDGFLCITGKPLVPHWIRHRQP